jgi:hypothetical protein
VIASTPGEKASHQDLTSYQSFNLMDRMPPLPERRRTV